MAEGRALEGPRKSGMICVYILIVYRHLRGKSVRVGVFPAADNLVARHEPAGLVKGLDDIIHVERHADLIEPVRRIKDDISVQENKFRVFFGDDLLEIVEQLFFVEHVRV